MRTISLFHISLTVLQIICAFQELNDRVPLFERGNVSPCLFPASSHNPGAMYFPFLFATGCSALLLAAATVPMV